MVDITIRGAGIFGLSIAWVCTQRGARVQIIDPNGPGAGASGGLVGALAPHVPENWNQKKAFQFDSLIAASDFWAEAETSGGVSSGYGRTGRLQPIMDEHTLLLAKAREQSAKDLWQGLARWQVLTTDEAGEWAPLTPTGLLIYDTLSARMHPRRACQSLVAALASNDIRIAPEGEDAGAVIWCTGIAGLDALNEQNTRMVGNGVNDRQRQPERTQADPTEDKRNHRGGNRIAFD